MSYALLLYGNQLASAVDACPPDSSLREVLRESVSRIAKAYERRIAAGAEREVTSRAIAGVSLHLTGVAVRWCLEEGDSDLPATMDRVLACLETVFCKCCPHVVTRED